jgi:PAS domain S-box-containing protein
MATLKGDKDMDAALQSSTEQQQASQYARSLIEASLDPLVTISPEGKVTDVNEATIKVTGVQRTQLIGTDFSNYFTDPDKAREGYRRVFEKGFVTDYPLTIRHSGGKMVDVRYNASVYRDVNGNVLGVFASARDVTETRRAMLETAQKEAEAKIAEQRAREEQQRARELDRLAELERFQKLTVGRELKMIALKKEIEELKREVEQLRPVPSPERALV